MDLVRPAARRSFGARGRGNPNQGMSRTGMVVLIVGCVGMAVSGCASFTQSAAPAITASVTSDAANDDASKSADRSSGTAPTTTSTPSSSTTAAHSYSADWSSGTGGWIGPADWKTLDGLLVNDGTGEYSRFRPILAPFAPTTRDYAVEAEIRVTNSERASSFGIVLRTDGEEGGYAAGVGKGWDQTTGINDLAGWWGSGDLNLRIVEGRAFDPGPDWHTYRVEARGNVVRLLIDGTEAAVATHNKYLSSGQVGLWCNQYQLEVRSFELEPL